MVYLTDKETNDAVVLEVKKDMEKYLIEKRTKEAIVRRLLNGVKETEKIHGYLFWRVSK